MIMIIIVIRVLIITTTIIIRLLSLVGFISTSQQGLLVFVVQLVLIIIILIIIIIHHNSYNNKSVFAVQRPSVYLDHLLLRGRAITKGTSSCPHEEGCQPPPEKVLCCFGLQRQGTCKQGILIETGCCLVGKAS